MNRKERKTTKGNKYIPVPLYFDPTLFLEKDADKFKKDRKQKREETTPLIG